MSIYTKHKIIKWIKLISVTGIAQLIVQLTGLLSGILIIRLLPVQEYAYYTIANTMLGTLTVLSDSGISSGVISIGGRVWNDKEKLGSILVTAMSLRKKFAFISLIIVLPILDYLLFQHHATPLSIFLTTISLIPAFYASISDSLLECIPKLQQNFISLQKNQISVSVGRLVFNTISLFIFPFTSIALLSTGVPRILGNYKLRKVVGNMINLEQSLDSDVQTEIMKAVKKILPGSLYYCFSSQITVWLISFFGSTNSIAEIGALGRLGMLLNFFSVMISTLIIPRFARLPNIRSILFKKCFLICLFVSGLTLLLIMISYFFPTELLYIIGNKYKGLKVELILSVVVSCLGLFVGTIYSLSISRSYILHPFFNIVIHLLSQTSLVILLNLSTTKNVLFFSIIDNSVILFMFLINLFFWINKSTKNA